jgi:polyhydroxyalkanoate synthesis regulator phasin
MKLIKLVNLINSFQTKRSQIDSEKGIIDQLRRGIQTKLDQRARTVREHEIRLKRVRVEELEKKIRGLEEDVANGSF